MPKAVSEITEGNEFARSATQGDIADIATRSFRIILNSPDEAYDIQETCGVYIGDVHPVNDNIACVKFEAQFDGDSRTVATATFTYESSPASPPQYSAGGSLGGVKSIPPDVRPANWEIETELVEAPLRSWRWRSGEFEWAQNWQTPLNTAQDLYEDLTTLQPMARINVTQFVLGTSDPTTACRWVGKINSEYITLGSLRIEPHQLMFRGASIKPVVETYRNIILRGWNVTYSFWFKENKTPINVTEEGGEWRTFTRVPIGWDIAVPNAGRSVRAFNPSAANAWQEPYGQPLKFGTPDHPTHPGVIISPLSLPDGVTAGEKQAACVRVHGLAGNATSQAVAAQPIALNVDGTPRKVNSSRYPIVWAWQVYDDVNLTEELELRLE